MQDLSWSKLHISSKAQPTNRSGHVATLVNDTMLVFGGGCNSKLCKPFSAPLLPGKQSGGFPHATQTSSSK
jgi:hypothetical protein